MSESWIDPGSLEGDALRQWYLRSPEDVEQERQDAAARRYQDFYYGGAGNNPDPQFGREVPASREGIDPDFAMLAPSGDIDPGFTWVADGPNRFRSVRMATAGLAADPSFLGSRRMAVHRQLIRAAAWANIQMQRRRTPPRPNSI